MILRKRVGVRHCWFTKGMSDVGRIALHTTGGGYDAIAAVADNLLPRLVQDELLGRFWAHRGDDGVAREKQLLIDFLCQSAGGPMYYTGRDMKTTHKGMKISTEDWSRFLGHVEATLKHFSLPEQEFQDVIGFIDSTRDEIIEV